MTINLKITIETSAEDRASGAVNLFAIELENLPALTGSPKQIAWAEKIRASIISGELTKATRKGVNRFGGIVNDIWMASEEEEASAIEAMVAAFSASKTTQALFGQSAASFWIDHRSSSMGEMIKAST